MKKILSIALLAVILLVSAYAVIACDETPASDVYSGTLSEKGYSTENEAAKAYLQEEFAGETDNVVFESYVKKQDLTREEIEKLPLGKYKAADIEKAEKGEVRYREETKTRASDDEIEVQVTFVVLVFVNGKFHHCDLVALPGEKISKSYYTSVLDLSRHDSYVFETTAYFSGDSVPAGEINLTFSTQQKMIYTKEGICLEMKTSGMSGTPGMQDMDTVSYVIQKDDNSCYLIAKYKLEDNEEWLSTEIPGTLKDYSANMIMAMDQTYFIKTDDGFKLDEKKYGQYLEKIYGQLFEALTVGVNVTANKASAVYHVKDGYLSAAKGAFDLTLTDGNDTMKIITSNTVKLSGINTATLTIPQEALDVIK